MPADKSSSRLLLTSYLLAGVVGVVIGALAVLYGNLPQNLGWGVPLSRLLGLPSSATGFTPIILSLLLGLLIVMLIVSWIGFWGTSELRSRLSMLADASAAYAAGRLQHRIEMAGEDDLAVTANRLNAMAQILQDQVRALQEAARNNQELRKNTEVAATLKERERVQRELHDRVSQDLFGLAMLCSAATLQQEKNPQAALSLLPEITQLAKRTQAAMRSLLLELRPQRLAERSLVNALQGLCKELSERTGNDIECVMHISLPERAEADLEPSMEDALFLIAQEGLLNALRHAQAQTLRVELYIELERIVLRVWDDGIGITDAFHKSEGSRFTSVGLSSMRERAQLLGGSCTVSERSEGGTEVLTIIPRVRERNRTDE